MKYNEVTCCQQTIEKCMSSQSELNILLKDNPEILEMTLSMFQDNYDVSLSWLTKPVKAIGGRTPISLMEENPKELSALIGRIEQGDCA